MDIAQLTTHTTGHKHSITDHKIHSIMLQYITYTSKVSTSPRSQQSFGHISKFDYVLKG